MKYATKVACDGDTYSMIAACMTQMGYPMNHCTARSVVLKVLEQIVEKISEKYSLDMSEAEIRDTARSPKFQAVLTCVLDQIEIHNDT